MLTRSCSPFIPPATSVEVEAPPLGGEWVHEIKFDGYRMQAQKVGLDVRLFSRQGKDCSVRFSRVRDAVATLPCSSAILDAELIAMGAERDDFWAIRARHAHLQLVCFDLLLLEGEDLRTQPLVRRKTKLKRLIGLIPQPSLLCYSEHFDDALGLLADAEARGLEGIVSKKRDSTYAEATGAVGRRSKRPPGARPMRTVTPGPPQREHRVFVPQDVARDLSAPADDERRQDDRHAAQTARVATVRPDPARDGPERR